MRLMRVVEAFRPKCAGDIKENVTNAIYRLHLQSESRDDLAISLNTGRMCLILWLWTNPVFPVLLRRVHESVNPLNESLHVLLRLVLGKTDAHRYMDILSRHHRENLLLKLCPDSFRRHDAASVCGFGQEDGEFFAAVTIGGVGLAQTSFHHLAESHQYLIFLVVAVSIVKCV